VLLIDGGGATGIKPVGEDFEILDGEGGSGHGVGGTSRKLGKG
jgi:hypothetical protein